MVAEHRFNHEDDIIHLKKIIFYSKFDNLSISWEHITIGDQKAYSEAYLVFYDRFYNYGLKFTPDVTVVEDAIQEVLMGIWLERGRLPGILNPEGYFFSSFRNHLFRKIKAGSRQLTLGIGEPDPEFGRDTILINHEVDKETRQRLQRSIDNLSARQREAIFLRFYEGLSYDEVGAVLGITTKATYKLVARALLELKGKMALPMALILMLLINGD